MERFDEIIVPLDGYEIALRALSPAHRVAAQSGARIRLVTSTCDGDGATEAQLDEAARCFPDNEVLCSVVSDKGAAEAIIDLATSGERRLVCLSTHGRGGFRRAVLGSVADQVVSAGSVPVLLVGPECDPGAGLARPGPILLCVDGSDRSPSVIDAGRLWTTILGRDVRMVTVTSPFDGETPTGLDERFAELAAPLERDGLTARGDWVVNSSVPVGLVAEAKQLESPLMVVAPSSLSGVARLLLGSTTRSILGLAPCPVLIVPPHRNGRHCPGDALMDGPSLNTGPEALIGEPTDRDLVELDLAECLTLLSLESVGRLATCDHRGAPDIVPVNVLLHDGVPILRTHEVVTSETLPENVASLEIDRFDWFHRTGWSVLVKGKAEVVDPAGLTELGLESWARGGVCGFVRINPTSITGRRVEMRQLLPEAGGYL